MDMKNRKGRGTDNIVTKKAIDGFHLNNKSLYAYLMRKGNVESLCSQIVKDETKKAKNKQNGLTGLLTSTFLLKKKSKPNNPQPR